MLGQKEVFQAGAAAHSGCAHISVLRGAPGLNEGSDFTGRCRKGAQEEDGQNAEYNLYLFQNVILDEICGRGGAGNENGFCLFINLFFLCDFAVVVVCFYGPQKPLSPPLHCSGGIQGAVSCKYFTNTPVTKRLQRRAVATRWQVELIREKILAISCP